MEMKCKDLYNLINFGGDDRTLYINNKFNKYVYPINTIGKI